jgi:hypothetical protein
MVLVIDHDPFASLLFSFHFFFLLFAPPLCHSSLYPPLPFHRILQTLSTRLHVLQRLTRRLYSTEEMTTNTNQTEQVVATSTGANADKESIHPIPETAASGAQAAETSVPALTGRLKMVSDEVYDIRKILQQVIRRLDRVNSYVHGGGVVSLEETSIDAAHTETHAPSRGEHTPRGGYRTLGYRTRPQRHLGRYPYSRKPNWTLKVHHIWWRVHGRNQASDVLDMPFSLFLLCNLGSH